MLLDQYSTKAKYGINSGTIIKGSTEQKIDVNSIVEKMYNSIWNKERKNACAIAIV